MRRIYLDHNATTPVDPAVLAAMLPYFSAEYGNPRSIHSFGQKARSAVERARESVAALIGARALEIVFTSGGTESDNAAIFGVVGSALKRRRNHTTEPLHVITTAIEHDAVLHSCQALEERGALERRHAVHEQSVAVTYVRVGRSGIVDPEDVRRAIRPETVLISVMHANNELGTIQPIAEIGQIAREAGVCFHTDAVQSVGKVPVDVAKLGVNLLSLSGHKIGAPKGVGALFVKKGTQLEPLLYGGQNERDRRAGTDNVTGIVGLGKAAELARAYLAENGLAEKSSRIAVLRDRLEQGLKAAIPGCAVNGDTAQRIPNTSNLMFPGVDSESLIIALDLAGLACSAGAACSSGAVDPSHVLMAIGLSREEARASVRLSLGHTTSEEDIAAALELIPQAVSRQAAAGDVSRENAVSRETMSTR